MLRKKKLKSIAGGGRSHSLINEFALIKLRPKSKLKL